MAIKINIGINRKIGLPNYGSKGASCNVEFEMDGASFDNGSVSRFQEAARKAYAACREAVETELADPVTTPDSGTENLAGGNRHLGGQHSNGTGTTSVRGATSAQVRAIFAIANRNRVDLPGLLGSRFGVARPDDLSIRDASSLIDELKNPAVGNSGSVSR